MEKVYEVKLTQEERDAIAKLLREVNIPAVYARIFYSLQQKFPPRIEGEEKEQQKK